METGEAPQPIKPESPASLARQIGSERRARISERANRFLSGVKEKFDDAANFCLGFDVYLGEEARQKGQVAKEKAAKAIAPTVEAGRRAWGRVVDTKNRLVQRGIDAKDRWIARYEQTRDRTKAKVADLSRRAAIWGLINVAEPIENRLRQIYEIPAEVREWQARREDVRAQKNEVRAALAAEAGEAKVKALQEQIARIQEATTLVVEDLNRRKKEAQTRAEELKGRAAARREQASKNFSKVGAVVQRLQTR